MLKNSKADLWSNALDTLFRLDDHAALGGWNTTMDVGVWLQQLGLGQYEAAFRESEIDADVLPELTEADLEKLGLPLGHRKRLLKAIANLGASENFSPGTPKAAPAHPTYAVERRQVTVMFTDLVGSTALSSRIDPEDLRTIIGAYHKCTAETVARFDGFVAKYMGDGVLIYFGFPVAHEDDAERAVRAGLALVTAVASLGAPEPLEVRIGVATGLVVVGDIIGSGEARERSIVGETPNLAARLQGIAEPNTVVIADSTRGLLGNLFELQDLGPRELKGIARPARCWAALRASSVRSRFEALHGGGLTALVGREEEMELLLRRWARAKTGEGRVVLISGEPGIGKSRLTAALLESLAAEPHTRLRYFCSPLHMDSAFYPIIGQMERAARLTHGDTSQARLDKLDALLTQSSTSLEDAALFAELLSLPNDGRFPAAELTPEQRRQRTLEALTSQLARLARRNPVLMIFEDAQWTDPTSLEAFSRAVERIAGLRVLLIVTCRPEFVPPWIGQPQVTALSLNRLTKHDVDALIDGVVGNGLLPASIRQDIVERSDGIPLFIEEMTKAVLEAEGEGETQRNAGAEPSPGMAVPASLQASLMARLDRLGPAKEVAQIGAAIGREFSHALLAAVVRRSEAELGSALDRLIAAGLVFRDGAGLDATYLFKHALVQDAAYGTLLREPRRALHARIAETFETQFAEIAESQPEMLARHCTEAGLIEKSANLWGKAGLRSLASSALAEAAEQLTRALAQIATLPSTPALRREEVKLQVALINPLMHVKGYAAPEAKEAAERARLLIERTEALGEPPADPLQLFTVLYGFWSANFVAFNGVAARELAGQFLTLAEKQRLTAALMIGHRLVGATLLGIGDIAEGRAHLDRAMALHDPAQHRPLATRFAVDAGAATLSWRSRALWLLGYPEAALADINHALDSARDTGQAATLMYVLSTTETPQILCGNYAAAKAQADELVALAGKRGAPLWKAAGTVLQGCTLALTGNASDAAIQMITAGITAYRSTGATFLTPWYLANLARAYSELGRADDAWRCIGEAMTAMHAAGERWCEADINRLAGEFVLLSPERDVPTAEGYFERALAIARRQQARSWELRAAMSMARLWRDQGKRDEARELLAPVYGWFAEGFDTLDLTQAKALLDELGA
jgi:predicted ATPase/class 3 adenylate cyclase